MNTSREALIIVDMQNGFTPGMLEQPELPVLDGESTIAPAIAAIREARAKNMAIIATQDWHPTNHVSFASRYGVAPFSVIARDDGRTEMVWPDHCIAGTPGAQIVTPVQAELDQGEYHVFRKGFTEMEDAYSGFGDTPDAQGGKLYIPGLSEQATLLNAPSLAEVISKMKIRALTLVGLATDYCVGNTALRARETFPDMPIRVVQEAIR